MKAFVMADFLGVDEHATDVCGVHIASGGVVPVLIEGSTSSGNSGNSMIAVILAVNHGLFRYTYLHLDSHHNHQHHPGGLELPLLFIYSAFLFILVFVHTYLLSR